MTVSEAAPVRADGRLRSILILSVILTTQLMVILDATVVTIAMPQIKDSLGFSTTGLSWVQNAYTLAFGGLLLLGARAGDILGRRKVLVAGIVVFTLASLLGGLAQSAEWLLAARVLQGVGGAIAAPATLALLMMNFAEGSERNRALALYSVVSTGGASIGLVLGGLLTDVVSWRWGLFINIPIGIALVLLARGYLAETTPQPGRFDIAGAVTSTLGIAAIVYGFIRAAEVGWSDFWTVGAFTAGAVLLVSFVFVERRAEQPITPLRLFMNRDRSLAYLSFLLVIGGMFGMFFFLTQFMQGVLGFGALRAGVAFLPVTLLLFVMVRIAPRIMERVSSGKMMLVGSALTAAGMIWLTQVSTDSSYLGAVVGPLLLFGLGAGLFFVPMTSVSLSGIQPEDAGAASGMVNVIQQVGGTIGLAVLVTVFGTASRGADGDARQVLTEGLGAAFIGSTVFTLLTLAVVAFAVRSSRPAVPAGELSTGA
jgi:EmrB/QacA subfamily drug resistance transporter